MMDIILFTFMVIMIACAIGCVYVICIASILTYEYVKEWIEDLRDEKKI